MPLGFHVSKTVSLQGKKHSRKMADALREGMQQLSIYGFQRPVAQIFVSGPQSFTETLSPADKDEVGHLVREQGLTLVIHGAYADHPWNRSPGSIHNIKQEMMIAAQIGATGVIIHLGAGAAQDENLAYCLDKIGDIDTATRADTILWLEIHTAKSSRFTYETPEKIIDLFRRVKVANVHGLKIGLCIDTAHLFSCGMSLMAHQAATEWLNGVAAGLAADNIPIMIHLNDSASTLGSGKDKHAALTLGNLWGSYNAVTGVLPIAESGLVAVLDWAERNDIVVILERDPELVIRDLALIRGCGYFQ
jgi:endonuclease IV